MFFKHFFAMKKNLQQIYKHLETFFADWGATFPNAVIQNLRSLLKKTIEIHKNLIKILYNFYQDLSYLSDIKITPDKKVINSIVYILY